jgi:hypothetical protein
MPAETNSRSGGRRAPGWSPSLRPTCGAAARCRCRPASANPTRSTPARSTAADRAVRAAESSRPSAETTAGCGSLRPPARNATRSTAHRSRHRFHGSRSISAAPSSSSESVASSIASPSGQSAARGSCPGTVPPRPTFRGRRSRRPDAKRLGRTSDRHRHPDLFAAVDADRHHTRHFHQRDLRAGWGGDQRESRLRPCWPAERVRCRKQSGWGRRSGALRVSDQSGFGPVGHVAADPVARVRGDQTQLARPGHRTSTGRGGSLSDIGPVSNFKSPSTKTRNTTLPRLPPCHWTPTRQRKPLYWPRRSTTISPLA